MRILLVHNHFQQPGGEDGVFDAEKVLLEHAGHQVITYERHNDEIAAYSAAERLALFHQTIWARGSQQTLRQILQESSASVAHFHNVYPLISPAAYYVCQEARVPVVQTLHNYRLYCLSGFLRDGHVCEKCLDQFVPWPGVVHACYRKDRAASGAVAAMLTVHRALGTWRKMVDVYIALSEFARERFIQGGLPAEKIVVKPNFVYPDPGPGKGRGSYFLFVGRLSREKGLDVLLAAWERLGGQLPLKILGDGPLTGKVANAAQKLGGVEWLGRKPHDEVLDLMRDARVLIVPSICYENCPLVILEAYAVGLPVIGSDLGSIPLMIDHGRTGLHFRADDPDDLAAQVEWVLKHPGEAARMRQEARSEFETKYTAEHSYRMLMEIYEMARIRASRNGEVLSSIGRRVTGKTP